MQDSSTTSSAAGKNSAAAFDPNRKIYQAGDHTYSVVDLLSSAVS